MLLNDCGCTNNPCLHCNQVAPCSCNTDKCRQSLSVTDIAELVWLQGLDVNLCKRFQRLADVVSLRDCAGNRVTLETPIVLCSDFRVQLCTALSGLASGGVAIPESTQLIGNDCRVYTLPPAGIGTETPNAVVDTSTIDFSATGTLNRIISGVVKVSADVGNTLSIHADGLYVPTPAVNTTACQQLQAFTTGVDTFPGIVLIGADCQKHVLSAPDILTVTDTSSIDLVLVGTNLQANLLLDPATIGRITGSGFQITCADVLTCAPAVTVLDTSSVNMSLAGQQVSATVIISPDAFNALELHGNGLFVDVCSALNSGNPAVPAVVGTTVLVGADCNRYTIPAQPVTGSDTSTALTTVTGSQVQVDVHIQPSTLITIAPQGLSVTCEDVQDCIFSIANNFWSYNDLGNSVTFFPSADAGNQIGVGTDGRPFVPAAVFTANNTDCIQLNLIAGNLTAYPIISVQPSNGLLCLSDGLFASNNSISITGVASNCFNVSVAMPVSNQFEISVFPIISGAANNQIQCTASGLFVPVTANTVSDTSTIDLTLAGANISGDVKVSPNSGNGIVVLSNGLYAPAGVVSGIPYRFSSPLATSHNIVHNLAVNFPLITVWDMATLSVLIPDSIVTNSPNDLTINFFVARAIAGSIF